ncbi:MAG: S8 family serine peptidase [Bdellovibrio sp.]
MKRNKTLSSNQKRALLGVSLAGLIISALFVNCSGKGFSVDDSDADPFLGFAWHINNTGQSVFATAGGEVGFDLNLLNTWQSGFSGSGVKILISDDGIEDTHEDLRDNYLYSGVSKNYALSSPYLANSSPPIDDDDNHGTSVAGLVAAVAANGAGTKGVAYKASLVSANFLSGDVTQTEAIMVDQAGGDFDVFNMSWGSAQNVLATTPSSFIAQLKAGATSRRSGKGALYVKAAGNSFSILCRGVAAGSSAAKLPENYCVGNSNFDADNTTPYTIMVAALNAEGYASSYSSPGSNIWISSFGGEFGDDSPAMITTDRSGCSKGFSTSDASGLSFEKGGEGNSSCNYTATFNGTSAAAPVLTGVVALLLEVNPSLTWRDVKYILASTATPVNYRTTGSISHPSESTPSSYVWEQVWVVNGAGFKFHNWYGFGRVNVDDAVTMAKSYTSPFGTLLETNWVDNITGLSESIPDNSATGASSTTNVGTSMKIEAVQLKVWITHPDVSQLAIELTSPSGTKSILVNMNNSLRNLADYDGEILLSNAFYRENSAGTWTLKVIDGKTGSSGTLTRWSLNFIGSSQ